jgi:type I restriction enzyme S subunit
MQAEWTPSIIKACLDEEFPGEWGTTPKRAPANALVLRSTNLDDDGHVDLAGGAPRLIPTQKLATKRLKDGDILLEGSGGGPGKPVGRVALFRDDGNGPYLCSNFFRTLRPGKNADPGFLAWRLLCLYRQPVIWQFQQQTTGIINLKHGDYLEQQILLPPLPEQHRIAEILDTLDDAIRKTEQVIAKLQQMKQGLLHDLLTRGIDEKGELRDPEQHPEQFKDSPLGRIPKDWEILSALSVASRESGSTVIGPFGSNLKADDYQPDGVPVLFVRDIRDTGFQWKSNVYLTYSKALTLSAHEVQPGDVLATKMGLPPCIAATYPTWMPPGIITADIIRLPD